MTTIMNRDPQHKKWFALTDAESCRLLSCGLTAHGKVHVDEFDTLLNTLPEQEHNRPMTSAGETHNVEHHERRFGGEIVSWLQKRVVQHEIDQLAIFAPPRMLGVLRMVPLGSLKGHVDELKGDLMRLSAGQLAEHPMVLELMSSNRGETEASPGTKPTISPDGTAGDESDKSERRFIRA